MHHRNLGCKASFSCLTQSALSTQSDSKNFAHFANMAKVVCRGLDAPNPQIVCSAGQMPMTIRIR